MIEKQLNNRIVIQETRSPTRAHLTRLSLRFRLVVGRAKNALPAGLRVITAGQVKPSLGYS